MRKVTLAALFAFLTAFSGLLAGTAEAGHRCSRLYAFHDGCTDPYAYRYEPRGYYPYYNSGYWKPAHVMRKRKRPYYVHPPYFPAWGYPDRYYRHRAWHAYHHGYIRHNHW
jgi:hypothetical protein